MSRTTPELVQSVDAPHPFNQLSADLILRTADLVDFRVQSTVLALASPFFAAMFALPQPAATTSTSCVLCKVKLQGETAVIPVSEDSAALELLLRLVYPILKTHSQIEDPQEMVPALLAATKYEMELPVQMMFERLVALTPAKPLQVWGAASRTGLEDVARQAADALKASWTPQANKEVLTLLDGLGDMAGISAGDYFRLKQFLGGGNVPTLLSPGPTSEVDSVATQAPQPSSPFSTDFPGIDLKCQPTSRHGPPTPLFAHQVMLSSRSSVLKTQILSLRETASSASLSHGTEPMVLDFDEEADVVSDLLAVCYGGEDDLPTDLIRIAGLLAASQKYCMTRVARWSRRAWDAAAALGPLEAYFVALDHRLTECAEAASRYVLARPIADDYTPAMENAPALSYHRLLEYYDTCHQIVRERLFQASSQIPDLPSFASVLVQYILSTPDEIELALDDVKINLST